MTALIALFIYWVFNIVVGAYYAGTGKRISFTPGGVFFQALVYLAFAIWLLVSLA